VKFLVDAQLPPALAQWLREAGHEASHVEDFGLREAEDQAIWRHAEMGGFAILTKDEDFASRTRHRESGAAVIWLRIGNSTNPALRKWIEARLPSITRLATQGDRLIEVV
jgi:predicted nuclease of predicted toxin-antitoxin system